MKNFLMALLVFLVWGSISMTYLYTNGSLWEPSKVKNSRALYSGEKRNKNVNVADSVYTIKPSIHPDNLLLSNEMENTVNAIKEEYGMDTGHLDHLQDPENAERTQILFPQFEYGKLVIDQNLVDHGRTLEKIVAVDPNAKITFVGHFNDAETSLDNYFEGLQRAKQLKQYITENFNIAEHFISAISEGESRTLADAQPTTYPTKNNRIEILIED